MSTKRKLTQASIVSVAVLATIGVVMWATHGDSLFRSKDPESRASVFESPIPAGDAPASTVTVEARAVEPVSHADDTVDAVPDRGLRGTVYDAQRKPLSGARVNLLYDRAGDGSTKVLAQAESAADGSYRFSIERPAQGTSHVLAESVGLASDLATWPPGIGVIDLRLEPGESILGFVRGPDKTALAGAKVEAIARGVRVERAGLAALRGTATTNGEGAFTVHVPSGAYLLRVSASGFRSQDLPVVQSGTESLSIELSPVSKLAGRVVDGQGRGIAARIELRVFRERNVTDRRISDLDADAPFEFGRTRVAFGSAHSKGPAAAIVQAGKDGLFEFSKVEVEQFVLTARASGFVSAEIASSFSTLGAEGRVELRMIGATALGGTVVDTDGQALGGVVVSLARASMAGEARPDDEAQVEPAVDASTETDSSGRFAFDSLPRGEYVLTADSKRHPQRVLDGVQVDGSAVDLDIELAAGFLLEGRVLSAQDGEGIVDAKVSVEDGAVSLKHARSATTGADGEFSLDGFAEESIEALTISAKGYATTVFESVRLGEERVFEIDSASRMSGRVLDHSGRSVSRAQVSLHSDAGYFTEVSTDIDGDFEFVDLEGGSTFQVAARHPEFTLGASETVVIDPGQNVEELDLVLQRGATIEVFVVDEDEAFVSRARVSIQLIDPIEDDDESAAGEDTKPSVDESAAQLTGPDGRVVFRGMKAGPYRVRAELDGFQFSYAQTEVSPENTSRVFVELTREHSITGVVVDEAGEAIEAVRVFAVRESPDPLSRGFRGGRGRGEWSMSRSDADGRFRLGQLARTKYSLTFAVAGFSDVQFTGVRVDQDLHVTLQPLASISGRVLDQDTDVPLSSFRVLLLFADADEQEKHDANRSWRRRSNPVGRWIPFDDPNGAFRIEGLEAGSYQIEVVADDYTGAVFPFKVRVGQELDDVVMRLEEGVSIRGYVKEKNTSERLPRARLYLLPIHDRELESENARERDLRDRNRDRGSRIGRESPEEDVAEALRFLQRAKAAGSGERAERDGSFALRDVADGDYMLVVEHGGHLPISRRVDVRDGVRAEYAIIMDRGESLVGRVRISRRRSGYGVSVSVESASGLKQSARTDRQGRFKVTGLLPGTYTVLIRRGSEAIGDPQSVLIRRGKKNEFDYDTR